MTRAARARARDRTRSAGRRRRSHRAVRAASGRRRRRGHRLDPALAQPRARAGAAARGGRSRGRGSGAALRRRPLGPQRAPAHADAAGSTTRSTSTGSASSGKGSSTSPRTAARCSSPTTPGAIPADAPAIMHGIETELGRPVYGLAENLFRALPVVGTLWSRGGGVAAHPDNAYRLLHDEEQLVLVFPEGHKGTGKHYRDRYQLHRFGRGGFVEIAMRAGVPGHPDRGRRRRGVDADPLQEQPAREAAQHPVLPGHREHAAARSARARRVLPREVPHPRAAAGALRRPARTRSATRAAA